MKKSKAKTAIFIVVISMLLAITLAYSVNANAAIPGDVNGDGTVNVRDATTILLYVYGKPVELVNDVADANGDGVIDTSDAEHILKYITNHPDIKLETGDVCEHELIRKDPIHATCTNAGKIEHWACSICSKLFKDEKGTTLLTEAATVVPQLGNQHTEVIDPAVAATCTTAGKTEGKHCSVCNEVIVAQTTIPAKGHTMSNGTCTVCGYTESTNASQGLEFTLNSDGKSYSVTGIGTCTDNDLVIPATYCGLPVTGIGKGAFYNCANLTSVIIPESVVRVGNTAFCDCTQLTEVIIPDSVNSMGYNAFYNCTKLIYNEYDNALYLGNNNNPYLVLVKAKSKSISNCEINSNTRFIYNEAFYQCSNLKSIIIPDRVTSIDTHAFTYCRSLTSITISDSVTDVGKFVFIGCDSLNAVYITDLAKWCDISFADIYCSNPLEKAQNLYLNGKLVTNLIIPNGVTSIGNLAFINCSKITSVTLPDSVTNIGAYAFDSCTELTSVIMGNSVTNIGNGAYAGCSKLASITIPDGVTSIGYSAFFGCASLKSVTIPDSVAVFGSNVFSNCTSLIYNEYDNAYYLGNNANPCVVLVEAKSTTITNCEINSNTRIIGSDAFLNCTNLTSVTIGNSVTSIGDSAFYGCSKLASITIPDSVTSIGWSAFRNCASLTSINIPESITSIEDYAFNNCTSLVYYEYDNAYYLGNSENPYLVLIEAKSQSITNCKIYNKTRFIYSEAFYKCQSLVSISIPESVTIIGEEAFAGCTNLTTVIIPNGITIINMYTFQDCTSLNSITIPDSVTNIYEYAFDKCTNLTDVYYTSAEAEWNAITVGAHNDELKTASIHYNS